MSYSRGAKSNKYTKLNILYYPSIVLECIFEPSVTDIIHAYKCYTDLKYAETLTMGLTPNQQYIYCMHAKRTNLVIMD
jgi:hypothetical protein